MISYVYFLFSPARRDGFLFLFFFYSQYAFLFPYITDSRFVSFATRRYWTTPAELFLVDTDLENIKYAELAKCSAEFQTLARKTNEKHTNNRVLYNNKHEENAGKWEREIETETERERKRRQQKKRIDQKHEKWF